MLNFRKLKKSLHNNYLTKEEQRRLNIIKGVSISIIIAVVIGAYDHFIAIPAAEQRGENAMLKKYNNKYVKTYILKKTINRGNPINDSDLKTEYVSINAVPQDARNKILNLNGKVARFNIPSNSIVLNEMLVDKDKALEDDVKLENYSQFKLSPKQKKGDYIDVRIRRKDGTDEVVAAKKLVEDIINNNVFFNTSDLERNYINNATVEASLDGAELYTVTYVDPQNQPEAQVTYKLDSKIQKMIKDNSEIVKKAQQQLSQQTQSTTQTSQNNSSNSKVVNPNTPTNSNGNK